MPQWGPLLFSIRAFDCDTLAVLGLEASATHDEVKATHHRLMKKLHPDQGGSKHLATQVNQAKDQLLRE